MTAAVFAHSIPGKDESLWESLSDHLTKVAERAESLAAVFGGQELARGMGALHDIGKAQAAFQAYIRGQGASVDHSTAGAVIAARKYPAPFGRMMAFGIAGHHALAGRPPDTRSRPRPRDGRSDGAGAVRGIHA